MKSSLYYLMHSWNRANFPFANRLLVWKMQILIHGIYLMQNIYFLKHYHRISRSSMFWQNVIIIQSYFCLLQHRLTLMQILILGNKYFIHCQVIGKVFPKKYVYNLVLLTVTFVILEWKDGHWKQKMIIHFGHLQNVENYFQK